MRFRLDSTWQRTGRRTVLGGSPFRRFEVTEAGAIVVDGLEAGRNLDTNPLIDRLLDAGAIHPVPSTGSATFVPKDVTIVTPQLGGSVRSDGRITVDDGTVPPLAGADVRLPVNRGPSTARNAGRRLVTTPIIAFVDSDVTLRDPSAGATAETPPSSWLDALLAHFDEPAVALVAPRVVGDPSSSLDLGHEPARIRSGSRVSYVPAAAILVRAEAFDDVGGFDERLRFGEDVDFVWRLDQAGWRCRYEPAVTVWHAPRPTWSGRLAQQVGYGSSSAPLALRHPAQLAPWRGDPLVATIWALVGGGHPLAATIAALGHVESVRRRLTGIPGDVVGRLAATSLLHGGRQFATAIRRAWWPIALAASLGSRRARRITFAAAVLGGRSTPTDVAFGWGVWKGMIRLKTWRPIVPTLSRWG